MLDQQLDRVYAARPRGVWLVGGVGRLPEGVEQRYPGWRAIVPDLMRWLIPTARVSGPHLCRGWDHVDCDPALLTLHESAEAEVMRFWHRAEHRPSSAEHQWFWPDGRHPNRRAHAKLTQELILPMLR